MTEITQADRDAAELAFAVWDNTNELALAFARHRIGQLQALAARVKVLEAALRQSDDLLTHWHGYAHQGWDRPSLKETRDAIVAARAALKGTEG